MFIRREIYIQKEHYSELLETKNPRFFPPKINISENSKLDFWNLLNLKKKNILKGQIKIMILSSTKYQVKVINIFEKSKNISAIQKF